MKTTFWMRRFYDNFTSVPPIFLDGFIAVGIAMLTAISMGLATEESYKYLDPTIRFWAVLVLGAIIQGAHALSKFRDRAYSRYMEGKERQQDANTTADTLAQNPQGVTTTTKLTQEVRPNEPKT